MTGTLGEGRLRVAAVNLRGVPVDEVRCGFALLTPAHWLTTDVIDILLRGAPVGAVPTACMLHVGSAQMAVSARPLGSDTALLSLPTALPLRIGDRALLRDAGRHRIAAGVTVLDVLLRRRLLIMVGELSAMGAAAPVAPVVRDRLAEPAHWAKLRERLGRLVIEHEISHPLEHGLATETARRLLNLPDVRLVNALVSPPLSLADDRISQAAPSLPPAVAQAVATLHAEHADHPYLAPEAYRLAELGLGSRELTAAVRAGALARVADGIYVLPAALASVPDVLARLPQPFTVSAAREALGTTRRVAVPLMELLDARGQTKRLPASRRELVG